MAGRHLPLFSRGGPHVLSCGTLDHRDCRTDRAHPPGRIPQRREPWTRPSKATNPQPYCSGGRRLARGGTPQRRICQVHCKDIGQPPGGLIDLLAGGVERRSSEPGHDGPLRYTVSGGPGPGGRPQTTDRRPQSEDRPCASGPSLRAGNESRRRWGAGQATSIIKTSYGGAGSGTGPRSPRVTARWQMGRHRQRTQGYV